MKSTIDWVFIFCTFTQLIILTDRSAKLGLRRYAMLCYGNVKQTRTLVLSFRCYQCVTHNDSVLDNPDLAGTYVEGKYN